jgi:hypothetical protein
VCAAVHERVLLVEDIVGILVHVPHNVVVAEYRDAATCSPRERSRDGLFSCRRPSQQQYADRGS